MEILGVKIDNLDIEEVLERVDGFLNDGRQHYCVTLNPEFLVKAQKDSQFKDIINQADLSVPDGIGLILASWILGQPIKKRVVGVNLMERICQRAVQANWPVLLVGAEQGVAEKVAANLRKKYSGLNVEILGAVPQQGAAPKSILFVALGAPKQEKWIVKNLKQMPSVKLALGVGGAFDFISGRARRAPKLVQKVGLEWFWRFSHQPRRVKRIYDAVIKFPLLVIKSKLW